MHKCRDVAALARHDSTARNLGGLSLNANERATAAGTRCNLRYGEERPRLRSARAKSANANAKRDAGAVGIVAT